ncbi:hypothetical protein BV25DRAFT_1842685 [Artomyces pyxidatus]|uniref:Uncharacterized protein n=1 Tax=Artomyces pyxidatus TaxID=48021 RepID=A0ACB8SH06_9AGAM|nr:hypothetical protein BV25DRAFT_1842685 [Artomyces pyxidatus]
MLSLTLCVQARPFCLLELVLFTPSSDASISFTLPLRFIAATTQLRPSDLRSELDSLARSNSIRLQDAAYESFIRVGHSNGAGTKPAADSRSIGSIALTDTTRAQIFRIVEPGATWKYPGDQATSRVRWRSSNCRPYFITEDQSWRTYRRGIRLQFPEEVPDLSNATATLFKNDLLNRDIEEDPEALAGSTKSWEERRRLTVMAAPDRRIKADIIQDFAIVAWSRRT